MSKKNQKLLRVVAALTNKEAPVDETGSAKWLFNEGALSEEIEGIWLNSKEPLRITGDAYSFLVRLKEKGLIDDDLQDEIIEMAMLLAVNEISIDDIKGITAMLVFDKPSERWEQICH